MPNPISIIRIVEYSTISVLEYFRDILDNVGLPESRLESNYNFVTHIINKEVRCESNRIKKNQSSLIKSETIESNQIDQIKIQLSQIQLETAASTELRMTMMVIASDT